MFTKFEQIYAELKGRGNRKRMVAAWGVDTHTVAAAAKAVELGLADVTLVGDQDLIAKARGRMEAYDLNAIVANDIDAAGRSATSVILITANSETEISGTKSKVSDAIMDYCARL